MFYEPIKIMLKRVTLEIRIKMAYYGWNDPDDNHKLKFGPPPLKAINNGWCEDWAYEAVETIGSGQDIWLDDLLEDDTVSHCVFELDGKYYDAECLEGTENPHDLIRGRLELCPIQQ
jgi:hypothetical protein